MLIACTCLQPGMAQQKRLLGEPVDMSLDFKDFHIPFSLPISWLRSIRQQQKEK